MRRRRSFASRFAAGRDIPLWLGLRWRQKLVINLVHGGATRRLSANLSSAVLITQHSNSGVLARFGGAEQTDGFVKS